MADVVMTYGSLQAAAGQVKQAKANLEEVIAFMTSSVGALEGAWQGESYNALVSAWNESKPTMQRLAEALGNYAPGLENAAAAQQETEAANAGAMSGLAF